MDAGRIFVNRYPSGDVSVPFGGNRQSGYGRAGGMEALRHFVQVKSVSIHFPVRPTMIATQHRFKAVKDESLRTKVLETLKDAIFSGKLRPGERLPELRVAGELEVSQATGARSAHAARIARPRRASKTRRVTRPPVLARRDARRVRIRIVLETMAFTEAAARMNEAHFAALDKRLAHSPRRRP